MLRANTVWHRADLCRKLTWLRRDTSCARRGSTMSQFLAKVEAIRNALGLRPAQELPAPLAISEAMVLMGIKANETWALPERVEALVEALDLPGFGKSPAATQAAAPAPSPAATQTAAPAPKPAATMPVPASAPSAKALGKRKSPAEEPQRAKSKQPKLYDSMVGATKLQFNRRELDQAAAAQRTGEAIAYNELESKYSQPVVKFRSEITEERGEGEGSSGRTYECDLCLKSFDTAIGLRNHMQWHEKPLEEGIDELIRRSFAGTVSARMLVADGGAVRLYLLVNGKSREAVDSEAAEARRAWEAGAAARAMERQRRRRERETDEAANQLDEPPGEARRGSMRRIQYSAKEKVRTRPLKTLSTTRTRATRTTCRPLHARLRRASRSRTNRRVQSSSPSARRRRRQVMRWLANQFFTIGRWWAGVRDRSWSATRMGARSRRLTVSE
jgi:hypothetical protein